MTEFLRYLSQTFILTINYCKKNEQNLSKTVDLDKLLHDT